MESIIHRFEILDPYKSNLLREVKQLRAHPFLEDTVEYAFYLIADILEDYLKYIKKNEIENFSTKKLKNLNRYPTYYKTDNYGIMEIL